MPPKVRSVVGKLREESRSSCEREQFLSKEQYSKVATGSDNLLISM
jgi:hypothetical protein